jgi:GT2 family glycosyltransferase/glycosyltransferase involved in cell wall biosynthesis
MWGTSWRQRLRLTPLYVAMIVADRLAAMIPAPTPPAPSPWRPGLTVIIPERDAPEMLARALASLYAALATIDEPQQVIVVANGAPSVAYRDVAERFPDVEWIHVEAPLGFGGAIELGLRHARYDGTYLMNNDMTLDPRALAELMPLRTPDVFAIASQIFQNDAQSGRREETGFTDWYANRLGVHLYHAPVPSTPEPVAHLCASGGAALFRTAPLKRYVRASRCYDPFYWEDAEWGVRAWRDGLRVLFCPRSHAMHEHRMTTARFYSDEEIDRIVERNRWLFAARHGPGGFGPDWMMARACELPYASQRELARFGQAARVFRRRLARARLPQPMPPPLLAGPNGEAVVLRASSYSYRLRAASDAQPARPRLLVITPFAVFPPRHGGARRVAELLRGLRNDFDIALVTDEAALYDARSFAYFSGLCAIHLVQRSELMATEAQTLRERMQTHCHPTLAAAVEEALHAHRPDLVTVEHAELAELVRLRTPGSRWILDLHDAYGPADFAEPADAARFAETLREYDALTVCSEEDGAMLAHPRIVCIPNGSGLPTAEYQPSSSHQLLFIGPFRYGPNREGIVRFLREAWPAIRAAVPAASLLILGGDEHARGTAGEPSFGAEGVQVVGHRDDVPALLAHCAMTVNPLMQIRGSAIKLVESLAAGRVCVTTRAGARGFVTGAPVGLVIVPDVAAMAEPVIELLTHPEHRHALERPMPGALDRYAWEHSAARLNALYAELLVPLRRKAQSVAR